MITNVVNSMGGQPTVPLNYFTEAQYECAAKWLSQHIIIKQASGIARGSMFRSCSDPKRMAAFKDRFKQYLRKSGVEATRNHRKCIGVSCTVNFNYVTKELSDILNQLNMKIDKMIDLYLYKDGKVKGAVGDHMVFKDVPYTSDRSNLAAVVIR
ncbi:MAG: hypothetical protein JKY80_01520 [Mariprofundaceae bacterium]|nr:hypothetical protein [Mariprofundaceae bacterium]